MTYKNHFTPPSLSVTPVIPLFNKKKRNKYEEEGKLPQCTYRFLTYVLSFLVNKGFLPSTDGKSDTFFRLHYYTALIPGKSLKAYSSINLSCS